MLTLPVSALVDKAIADGEKQVGQSPWKSAAKGLKNNGYTSNIEHRIQQNEIRFAMS